MTCIAPRTGLSGYKIHRCRCSGCTAACRQYSRRYSRLRAYGRWQPLVDAEPARQHVQRLREAGLGVQRIAELAGVSYPVVSHLVWSHRGRPPSKRIRKETETALLAVRPETAPLAEGTPIPAVGTHRRMQALAVQGWSLSEQSRRLGRSSRNHASLLKQRQVTVRVAREIRDLYDELSTKTPKPGIGVTRTRRWAAQQGWAPPAAWDEGAIDDPDAVPDLGEPADDDVDEVLVREALAGHRPYALLNELERHALWRAWIQQRQRRFEDGPGVKPFADLFRIDRNEVQSLRYAVENNTVRRPGSRRSAATPASGGQAA